MTVFKILFLVVVAILLGGCAGHDFRKPGATGYEWQGSMLDGAKYLTSEPGTFVTAACPTILRDRTWVTLPCTAVTVQAEPPGRQAYSYVYKVKIRSLVGIPYGEEAFTAYVVGDHAECEKQSAAHNVRSDGRVNEGDLRLSADPAERCVGPFYIREAPPSASR
jgi:hypothetical protein